MKKLTIVAAMTLAFAGCAKEAENTQMVNAEFSVSKLFTTDGCTVYRFYDAGYYRYFTNCAGATMSMHRSGKVTVVDEITGGGVQ